MSDHNTWDYRLFDTGDGSFELRQVWYDAEGHIKGYSEDGIKPGGVTAGELIEELELVLDAFQRAAIKIDWHSIAHLNRTRFKGLAD